ncbi:MAG: ATP-dependent Clp protease adaptor ClpS [Pirellulales bacterium]
MVLPLWNEARGDAEEQESGAAVAEPTVEVEEPPVEPQRKKRAGTKRKPRRQPPYHVVLWNDDDHTHAYVIAMLQKLFGHPPEKGYQLACEVDTRGRAIVLTTTKEHAELKRDQIHAFGKDGLVGDCAGSMWSTIEPAEGE